HLDARRPAIPRRRRRRHTVRVHAAARASAVALSRPPGPPACPSRAMIGLRDNVAHAHSHDHGGHRHPHHHHGHDHSHAVKADAAVGVIGALTAASVLGKGNGESLEVEGRFPPILTELFAFGGTLVAGLVILTTGFERADAIASLAVAILMLRSGYKLQRKAIR